ncbi:carboxylesterase/lipase family protein [Streptomyces sp. 8L]|uniref:carboxylesterase/lipase family protein n=1 Tax=Streptomyces sp. 8L TaxID=2877242 RepID=UPI001CD234A6|nr:carboxylesterase family protein [Streptomyces sp. 8L]MCA1219835.1 carboxylesterase family protein [Streptomyces sp. 8L]
MGKTVKIASGKVSGTETADGIFSWLGIPYAAPPLGELRWHRPQPAQPWSGVRECTTWGAPALQPLQPPPGADPLGTEPPADMPPPAENCLYANVTAPANANGAPVLVWVHLGGYQTGSGWDKARDGSVFAKDFGAVVVPFNYRLGPMGFLAVPGEEHSGACGLHDQIAALGWVHDNIAAFGGDPGNVTIYGISAGAKSVANLMASPMTRGLFHRAVSGSGGGDHVATAAQATAVANEFLRLLGTTPDKLRTIPAPDLLDAQNAIGQGLRATWIWRPTIDGLALTRTPAGAISEGVAAGIPLLAQHCVNECDLYQLVVPDAASQADRVLEDHFGAKGRDELLTAFTDNQRAHSALKARVDIMSAERYIIPTVRLADGQSAHAKVWRSRFDGPLTGLPESVVPGGALAAVHSTDAHGVFQGGQGVEAQVHAAWGAFVTTGDPNTPELPDWPTYTTPDRATMIFHNDGAHVEQDPQAELRKAWEGREWTSGTWWEFAGGIK